jgi:hypothetical protein
VKEAAAGDTVRLSETPDVLPGLLTRRICGTDIEMKRIAVWAFYGIGALAVLYLALYAYAAFTGRQLRPGDPIHIFRNPDAPNYS